ncbi:hypothetical protein V6N11_057144 [Hibiscus sabdariffa]|uniref:Uncharacterized protein n=1 Tax=Hibiscus sabdariffa TaxID=183260 RepID=A0ABR2A336_9ROSI
MERNNMEKLMMTLLMLTIFFVAQQQVVADAAMVAKLQPEKSIGTCAKTCGFRCIKELAPPKIAVCFALCMIECKFGPSQVVYNCTKDCAKAIIHSNLGAVGTTYADKVVAASKDNGGKGIHLGFIEQEVVIMAEDVIINNTGPIPSIQLSDRVHNQIDHNMRNIIIFRQSRDGVLSHVDKKCSEINLYGPWVVVDNHRKQMSLNEHNGNKLNEMGEKMKGSHFAALASKNIDEQGSNDHGTGLGQLIQNNSMAYMASNPDKRKKCGTMGSRPVEVISMVKGQTPKVCGSYAKSDNRISNNYPNYGEQESRIVVDRKRIPMFKVVEWVQGAQARVDAIGKQVEEIVGLVEPHFSGCVRDNVIAKLGFLNTYRIETNGFSGGFWLLWDDSIKEFLFTTGLIDLGFQGPPFTGVCGNLHQRLDRCLVNECWFDYYNEAFVQHLDQLGSDHRPLLFCLMDVEKVQINRSFHFILAWQEHSQFSEFIQTTWACDVNLVANLDSFCTKIEEWNVDTFGHIG